MTKTLVMSFLNEEGKKVSIRVNNIKDDIKQQEVIQVMDLIIAKGIFFSKGGNLKLRDSAYLINKEETKLEVK